MQSYKLIIMYVIIIASFSCGTSREKEINSYQNISDLKMQDSLFRTLILLTNNTISLNRLNDSLGFLVLPIEAACPSCRKKTIDSIVKYVNKLDDRHFIVISGTGNKLIKSYFDEQGKKIPEANNKIFIDSNNQAFMKNLIFTKPVIYYSYNKKVYQKVSCVPVTIKEDLHRYFESLN